MANPQKENGYTPIANEIVQALGSTNLPSSVMRILMVILRKTYGFNKKSDKISHEQFVNATDLSRRTIINSILEAEAKNLIKVSRKKVGLMNEVNEYFFNKDYHTWVVNNSAPSVEKKREYNRVRSEQLRNKNRSKGSEQLSQKVVNNCVKNVKSCSPTKDTIQKTIQKRGKKQVFATPSDITKGFFKGVGDLMEKVVSNEAEETRVFLRGIQEKFPGSQKGIIWEEIKKFYLYWTELNSTGTKERWQKEKTFQVDRRLMTWFGKVKGFSVNNYHSKGRGLVE